MRLTKGINNTNIMISTEEYQVLMYIKARGEVDSQSLPEYESRLAESLSKRGALESTAKNGSLYYRNIK